ncbi:MAG: calcium-binding protein [Ascidiaceihabitans sp.]|nr:calcium-binding protein [Ascidiaceihabitans sp.]
MPYFTTNSEKKFFNTPAGLYDASSSLNTTYYIAEGLLNAGYGALIRPSLYTADRDVYHLGILAAGNYTLDVDGNNWDWSNSYYGYDTNIAQFGVSDSAGNWIDYTTSAVSELTFTLSSATDIYAVVVGSAFQEAEYRIFYTYDGVSNSAAIWGTSASYTGSLISGQEIDASVTYSDADGNSDNIVATGWYLDGVYQTSSETFTLTDDHVGQTLTFRFAFYDDAGNLEASNAYTAGEILAANSAAIWGTSASYTGSLISGQEIDASVTYSDTDGNSDNIVATWWYLDGVYQTSSETFTLTDDHVGQTLTFRFAFYDDAGNLEASNAYTAGEVDYGASVNISNSFDARYKSHVEHLTLQGSGNTYGYGNDNNNTIVGNSGRNTLKGGSGNDYLNGGAGNDKLYGDAGNDRMLGGSGNDTYYVDSTKDRVYETTSTSGTNTTDAGGTDRIYSTVSLNMNAYNGIKHVEHLTLQGSGNTYGYGNDNNNTIVGNSGRNTLKGLDGNDVLKGNAGLDTLEGGDGRDYMYAGNDADRDVFIFRDIDETVKGSQRDRIYQFDNGEDDIHLRSIDANEDLAGDQNFLFSSDGAAANSVWAKDSGNNVLVRGDVNGDKIHDFEIYVASVDDLYAYDFIL